ncbi:MAG: hypothetical protein PHD49_05035 [Candidatus Shapirobacteria bacterium]|nr:hypothetical protein [Candidatus Shapirobacteria bacterium]
MIQQLNDQLKKIQQRIADNHIDISVLENLSTETKKAFDEAVNTLMVKRNLLKKINIRREYLKLWKRHGKQIVIPINWRYILSAPFIYGMVAPAIIWNIGLEIYHRICFHLYGIPLVNPKEYFVYDRQLLACLNRWEKINCYYCSYVNNLIRYSAEISGRTERYWCPIKYARRVENSHSQYDKFFEGEDPKHLHKKWKKLRDFSDITPKKS